MSFTDEDLKLLKERFWKKVKKTPGCWFWMGAKRYRGYGDAWWNGKHYAAHRLTYSWAIGPIPEGETIDHLCRNTLCVNPSHLEPVAHRINVLRGNSPSAIHAKQTAASCGHPFVANDGRRRYCKPCRTAWHRDYYRRNSEKILSRQKEYRHAI